MLSSGLLCRYVLMPWFWIDAVTFLSLMNIRITLPLLFVVLAGQAGASGYRFGSQSVSAQGNADANSAEAADAASQFYNPAGLTRIRSPQMQIGGTFVIPHFSYTDNGSKTFLGQSTGGVNPHGVAPDVAVAPNFYYVRPLTSQATFGLGVYVPYGAKLDYGDSWAGRYSLTSIELVSLAINPSIAIKIDEQQSLGFGVSAEYMKAKLTQAVDIPSAVRALSSSSSAATMMAAIAASGGNPAVLSNVHDASGKNTGDDWGAGFNVGYMFELTQNTRFGLAYRSAIHHSLSGDTTWDFSTATADPIVNRLLQTQSGKLNSGARVKITTPETASVNVYHQLNDAWALMSDVTWTRNSRLKNLNIEFPGSSNGAEVIRQNWHDTVRVSIGANYRFNEIFLLRTGFAYDQSPVRNGSLTHPALPDGDRRWYSIGLNAKVDEISSIDFAYSYVQLANARGSYANNCNPLQTACTGNGETTQGTYKTHLQMLGISYNRLF